jgi:hypothetical protein
MVMIFFKKFKLERNVKILENKLPIFQKQKIQNKNLDFKVWRVGIFHMECGFPMLLNIGFTLDEFFTECQQNK